MAAVRENFCNLAPLEIPRPKCNGMQFISTRGRLGFYRSIRAEGSKYGVQMKPLGPRRPVLHDDLFRRPETLQEEENEGSESSFTGDSGRSSQISSDSSPSSPVECVPDYPTDNLPAPLPSTAASQPLPPRQMPRGSRPPPPGTQF